MSDSEDPVEEINPGEQQQPEWLNGHDFSASFPKRLPDDCVEYSVFVIDSKLSTDYARREKLKAIQNAANALLKSPNLKDYIWQREKFHLDLIDSRLNPADTTSSGKGKSSEETSHVPGHDYYLHGQTNFGDSIADEWLIVHLLLELSKRYPSAWLRVRDPDGEFLLAEAANALPKWLEPELADNRVWIHRGELRIIPLQRGAGAGALGPTTPGLPGNVDLGQALKFLETTPHSTLHSPLIEAEAFYRLRDYPDAIAKSQHNALLSLPRRLAHLLHLNPSYIAPAIESFYLRDPVAVKPLATKDTATLLFPPEDFVTSSVRFPKVGYAQLHSQEFPPPPAWVGITPRLKDKAVQMGMKVSCGFEMLLRDPQNRDKREVREMHMLIEDIEAGDETLPTDKEIATWPKLEDDDKWLDIDFKDFDKELKGKEGKNAEEGEGFGDETTHKDLKDMVSRFEKFLNDDDAGLDGAEFTSSDNSGDSDSDEDEASDDEGEDKATSFTDQEFETAMREMMGMPDWERETSGLTNEARKLALEMEDEEEMERDEEEAKQILKIIEEKKAERTKDKSKGKAPSHAAPEVNAQGKNVSFANISKGKGKAEVQDDAEEEVMPIDELSSDDEDPLGGMDYELLKNMLESFKGQGGMQGPAGNLMGLMGMGKMPRDESG